jgi:hypothetical protein
MTLAAAQVVDTMAARLVPMPATGGRVYTSRLWPLTEADLPAWRVTADNEQVEIAELAGTNLHTLTVSAKAYARATADIDDVLHALAASGLALLFAATVPYGLQLESIERDLATEGEASVGVITLTSRAIYFVAPGSPETIIS